jgi:transposase
MRRSYVFRLRPTARQHVALAACVESHRELYNAALQERRDAWAHSKTRVYYGDQSALLSEIRSARSDQAVWSFSSQQATLRRLNRAFAGFFRRVKVGQKAGYPRFKGMARFDSVESPKDGDGARWLPEQRRVYLQGVGLVKVHVHRQVQGRVKTIQIKRHGRRWLLVLSCDDVPTNPLPATGRQAGIDVKPVPDPDNPGQYLANGARAKSGLSRTISDAGWGRFVWILRAKAEEAGRILIEVDPRHTSDRCENCGHTAPENRVTQAVFKCRRCGHHAQADEHAARNLLRAGLARHAQAA